MKKRDQSRESEKSAQKKIANRWECFEGEISLFTIIHIQNFSTCLTKGSETLRLGTEIDKKTENIGCESKEEKRYLKRQRVEREETAKDDLGKSRDRKK